MDFESASGTTAFAGEGCAEIVATQCVSTRRVGDREMAAKRTASQRGLGAAGFRLWSAVTDDFELDEHELALLREACRTIDTITDLQRVLDRDGVMQQVSFENSRVHPVLAELRQQRLVLTKIVAALSLPAGLIDGQDRPQPQPKPKPRGHHPPRGLRSLKGGTA